MIKFYRAIDTDNADTLFIVDECHNKVYCMFWDDAHADAGRQAKMVRDMEDGDLYEDSRYQGLLADIYTKGTLVGEAEHASATY